MSAETWPACWQCGHGAHGRFEAGPRECGHRTRNRGLRDDTSFCACEDYSPNWLAAPGNAVVYAFVAKGPPQADRNWSWDNRRPRLGWVPIATSRAAWWAWAIAALDALRGTGRA